jgi:hypothetical protein
MELFTRVCPLKYDKKMFHFAFDKKLTPDEFSVTVS